MHRFITIAALSVTFLLLPAIYGMESDENTGSVIISRKAPSERPLDSGETELRELHKKYQAHIESGENSENLFVTTSLECRKLQNHNKILREELEKANNMIDAQMLEILTFKRKAKRLITAGVGVITVGVVALGITLYH